MVNEWVAIVAWADQNVAETPEGAATLVEGVLDTGVPIAGPAAPLVSEFNLMELVAVLGRSPDGGRAYVGRIIECAWRLPRLYESVVDGRTAPWRAERIAELTRPLTAEAAEFVDRQLNAAIGGVGWAQLERLVTVATVRFDPERAESERETAADHRFFAIGEVTEHGLVHVDGVMDAADGHDLGAAVARRAKLLSQLGDDRSLDIRRSVAVAELARQDLALDLEIEDGKASRGRRVELSVHVTDTTLTGENPVARWDQGRCPVSAEQVKGWLAVPGTAVIVRPVIDLADWVPVGSYEIPDRLRRQVELRDPTCRFPYCNRPAESCDLDHVVPYARGGPICADNLAPSCRRHHRAKTHSAWSYTAVEPGHYAWTSPHGHAFHVGPLGTTPLTPDR